MYPIRCLDRCLHINHLGWFALLAKPRAEPQSIVLDMLTKSVLFLTTPSRSRFPRIYARYRRRSLIDEIHAKEMKCQATKNEIGEGSLRRYARELRLVRWVCLDSQRSGEDELTDGGSKASKEGIKWVIACHDTVYELESTNSHEEGQKNINQLRPLRGVLLIFLPDSTSDSKW